MKYCCILEQEVSAWKSKIWKIYAIIVISIVSQTARDPSIYVSQSREHLNVNFWQYFV